jgi:hypothetical protein
MSASAPVAVARQFLLTPMRDLYKGKVKAFLDGSVKDIRYNPWIEATILKGRRGGASPLSRPLF